MPSLTSGTPIKRGVTARRSPKLVQEPKTRVCEVRGCGRSSYARGLCQTHHRQVLTTGKIRPIRPYRKRTAGTVKFSGLRLTPECAHEVGQYAKSRRVSLGAAVAYILEEWVERKR